MNEERCLSDEVSFAWPRANLGQMVGTKPCMTASCLVLNEQGLNQRTARG